VNRKEPPLTDKPPSLQEVIGFVSFMALIISGFVFRSTVGDRENWSWALLSALIGVGSLATVLWLTLPNQYRLPGLGLLLVLVVVASLFGGGRVSGGVASFAALEIYAVLAMATVRQMGFTWNRIGLCLLWILYGGGLVVLLGGPFVLGAVFAFGWGGITWPLVVVLALFVLGVGAGSVAGLWNLESRGTEPTSPASRATAAGGFAAGVATSYFFATVLDSSATAVDTVPDSAGIVFMVAASFSVAATTLAGYALGAGRQSARSLPPTARGSDQ
jgi:hypothetical protein